MKRFLCASLLMGLVSLGAWGQYSLTLTTYSQNFDGLGTGSSTVAGGDLNIVASSLNGWYFSESGTGANTTITAGTGSSGTGDSYNLGASGNSNRTLGGLQSGTLNPTFGFYFTNNTGSTISDLAISYTGETWRVGTAGRSDRINFEYSTNATSLTTGTWTFFTALDYVNPGQSTGNGSVQHSLSVSNTLTGVNIANGATFFFRWVDNNASGADDAMGVNDLSFTATLASSNTITTGTVSTPPFVLANCAATAAGTVDFTSTGTFNAGNIYTAQLSNDIGSFASPVNIGTLSSTANSGTINITIPAGTVGGTGYLIRVVSSDPVATGTSSAAFTITQQGVGGCASSNTDYYRSVQTGNWGSVSTWESSPDNTNWIAATLTPTFNANTILIQNTHTVTIAAPASADQLTIQSGGILDLNTGGTLTVNDGGGDDVTIANGGIFILSVAGTPPSFSGSSVCNVATGGILRVSATGMTGAGTGVNASNFVYQHQSILDYTPTSAFSSNSVTYFPNVNSTTIPIFRTTNSGAITVGAGAGVTIINGIFECNGGDVSWQLGADKTFRNGIRGTGNVIALANSGKFIINGVTAEIGGTGSLILPVLSSLEIGSAGGTTATVTSNKTLTGNVTLIATSTFVELGSNNLIVTGTVTGGGTNAYIRTNGTGVLRLNTVDAAGKTFPIGNTSYNPVTITNGNNADYSARVETGIVPGIAFPSHGINRTWNIHASAVTPGVTVAYQYAGADANPGASPQPMNMEVLMYTGSAWGIIPGNGNIAPTGSDPYTVTTAATLTINNTAVPYALGRSGGYVLPLDYFISARAQKINNNAVITWNVLDAASVSSFEVQRSVNGNEFRTIATVNPVPNQASYSYNDAVLEPGTLLYRIKVNRMTGGPRYSNTAAIINDTKGLLITSVMPNPVSSSAVIVLSAAKQGSATFEVYDMAGNKVKQWVSGIAEGTNNITVNMNGLPAAVYHLLATAADARTVFRFVKQ